MRLCTAARLHHSQFILGITQSCNTHLCPAARLALDALGSSAVGVGLLPGAPCDHKLARVAEASELHVAVMLDLCLCHRRVLPTNDTQRSQKHTAMLS